jgi:esterase/lipase superfamily enzyme
MEWPMKREHHRWYSPSLGRDMELLLHGHGGARVLVFPTSQGRFYEWEDRGMVAALADQLEQGWLQFCCVDSVDAESWYARWKHPGDRAWRQEQYNAYLLNEVLPLTWAVNPNPFLITTGASFGAYHAANFAFRYPHLVGRMLGLSGVYDIRRFTNGFYNETVYFNNPVDFLQGEQDPGRLAALRRMDIIIATGHDDAFRDQDDWLSSILWSKGIGNALRIWDGWAHDWPWWTQMLRHYIGGHD